MPCSCRLAVHKDGAQSLFELAAAWAASPTGGVRALAIGRKVPAWQTWSAFVFSKFRSAIFAFAALHKNA
jgi:hypothetical protein